MKKFSVILAILLGGCLTAPLGQTESYLQSFGYLGTKDSAPPVLKGKVLTLKEENEVPLPDATITCGDIPVAIDSKGNFAVSIPRGTYSVKFHRNGCKDIILNNYNAETGETSDTRVILCKGDGKFTYDISKDKIGDDTRNK
jgi:hypothetical protein